MDISFTFLQFPLSDNFRSEIRQCQTEDDMIRVFQRCQDDLQTILLRDSELDPTFLCQLFSVLETSVLQDPKKIQQLANIHQIALDQLSEKNSTSSSTDPYSLEDKELVDYLLSVNFLKRIIIFQQLPLQKLIAVFNTGPKEIQIHSQSTLLQKLMKPGLGKFSSIEIQIALGILEMVTPLLPKVSRIAHERRFEELSALSTYLIIAAKCNKLEEFVLHFLELEARKQKFSLIEELERHPVRVSLPSLLSGVTEHLQRDPNLRLITFDLPRLNQLSLNWRELKEIDSDPLKWLKTLEQKISMVQKSDPYTGKDAAIYIELVSKGFSLEWSLSKDQSSMISSQIPSQISQLSLHEKGCLFYWLGTRMTRDITFIPLENHSKFGELYLHYLLEVVEKNHSSWLVSIPLMGHLDLDFNSVTERFLEERRYDFCLSFLMLEVALRAGYIDVGKKINTIPSSVEKRMEAIKMLSNMLKKEDQVGVILLSTVMWGLYKEFDTEKIAEDLMNSSISSLLHRDSANLPMIESSQNPEFIEKMNEVIRHLKSMISSRPSVRFNTIEQCFIEPQSSGIDPAYGLAMSEGREVYLKAKDDSDLAHQLLKVFSQYSQSPDEQIGLFEDLKNHLQLNLPDLYVEIENRMDFAFACALSLMTENQ